jgi:hypothetical protein
MEMYSTGRVVAAWINCACLAGCGGAMQQSRMSERNADTAKPLTAPLAVGGSLQPNVDIDLQGTASPTIELISARPDVATAADGKIVGRSPGVTAILITTKDGTVLDFHHLWVEQATRMTLHRQDDQARDLGEVLDGIDFLEGESIYVTPRVYFKSQELAGTVPGTWTIDPPVALLLKQGLADGRRLFATNPGEATLTVSIPGVSVRVPIRVLPKANAKPAAPPPASPPPAPASTIGGL